jgi:hypothetical protein
MDEKDRKAVGSKLNKGLISYSTHDLALLIALNLLKKPEYVERLKAAQLTTRVTMQVWFDQKKIIRMLVESFESSLEKPYK